MIKYEQERDEAAEKIITPRFGGSVQYCLRGNHHNDALTSFKAGADWANARAEKRAQELEDKNESLKSLLYPVLDYGHAPENLETAVLGDSITQVLIKEHKDFKEKIKTLEDDLELAMEALESIVVKPLDDRDRRIEIKYHNPYRIANEALTTLRKKHKGEG